jgi:hypothetical protein
VVATGARIAPANGHLKDNLRTWQFTGYALLPTGFLGDGITWTTVRPEEQVLVRGLDLEWRDVRPNAVPAQEPPGARIVFARGRLRVVRRECANGVVE